MVSLAISWSLSRKPLRRRGSSDIWLQKWRDLDLTTFIHTCSWWWMELLDPLVNLQCQVWTWNALSQAFLHKPFTEEWREKMPNIWSKTGSILLQFLPGALTLSLWPWCVPLGDVQPEDLFDPLINCRCIPKKNTKHSLQFVLNLRGPIKTKQGFWKNNSGRIANFDIHGKWITLCICKSGDFFYNLHSHQPTTFEL